MFTKIAIGTAPDGTPLLSILGKETFTITHNSVAEIDTENPIDFYDSDIYWGDNPLTDPIKHEVENAAFKSATDVLFVGSAQAPGGKKARFFDLSVSIGAFTKKIRVIGNRTVKKTAFGFEFTEPELFEEMPLHAGLAYGGVDRTSDETTEYTYLKNALGKGFIVKNKPEALHGLELPNIEDPFNLLTPKNLVLKDYNNWREAPDPVGIGPVAKNSYPRFLFSGLSMEQHIANEASRKEAIANGADPASMGEGTPLINPMFFNCAPNGLRVPYLKGDESISMLYMDKDFPTFEFRLPGLKARAWLDVGEGITTMDTNIHTVEVNKETNQLTMVWRASSYFKGVAAIKDFTEFKYGMEVVDAG